jgi:TPR repeat protein
MLLRLSISSLLLATSPLLAAASSGERPELERPTSSSSSTQPITVISFLDLIGKIETRESVNAWAITDAHVEQARQLIVDPNHPPISAVLTILLFKSDLDKSLKTLIKTLGKDKNADTIAHYNLGYLYHIEKKYSKSRIYLKLAAEENDTWALFQLGHNHQSGIGATKNGRTLPIDLTKARQYYKRAAKQGLAIAQYTLGMFYKQGTGVDKDLSRAMDYFMLAANQQWPEAENALGDIYYDEWWAEKVKAEKLAEKIRWTSGSERSSLQRQLDDCNRHMDKTKKDVVKFYGLSSLQGYGVACLTLGKLFRKGGIFEHNKETAENYFKLAAQRGLPEAYDQLGALYESNAKYNMEEEVKKIHYEKAHEFYSKAAQMGCAEAFYHLGKLYQFGNGCAKDRNAAENYFNKAHQRGYDPQMVRFALQDLRGIY